MSDNRPGQSVFNADSVFVYKQNGDIVVNTGTVLMSDVKVFDVTGRLLAQKKNINGSESRLQVGSGSEILMVQVFSNEGTVSKKIFFGR